MGRGGPDDVVERRAYVVEPLADHHRDLLRRRRVLPDADDVYAVALVVECRVERAVFEVLIPESGHRRAQLHRAIESGPGGGEEALTHSANVEGAPVEAGPTA